MLKNFGRGVHPEVEGDEVINSSVVAGKVKRYHGLDEISNALLDGRGDPGDCYRRSKKLHLCPHMHLYTVKNAQNVRYCCLVQILVRHLCLYAAR